MYYSMLTFAIENPPKTNKMKTSDQRATKELKQLAKLTEQYVAKVKELARKAREKGKTDFADGVHSYTVYSANETMKTMQFNHDGWFDKYNVK